LRGVRRLAETTKQSRGHRTRLPRRLSAARNDGRGNRMKDCFTYAPNCKTLNLHDLCYSSEHDRRNKTRSYRLVMQRTRKERAMARDVKWEISLMRCPPSLRSPHSRRTPRFTSPEVLSILGVMAVHFDRRSENETYIRSLVRPKRVDTTVRLAQRGDRSDG